MSSVDGAGQDAKGTRKKTKVFKSKRLPPVAEDTTATHCGRDSATDQTEFRQASEPAGAVYDPLTIDFLNDIKLVTAAAIGGDFRQRMAADYVNPDLNGVAASVNEMLLSADKSIGEFCRAMIALAEGDLAVDIRGDHHGVFEQLQKNVNLAMATLQATLGRQDAELFTDNAVRFSRLLSRFQPDSPPPVRISDQSSRPVASPARALRKKLSRAFGSSAAKRKSEGSTPK